MVTTLALPANQSAITIAVVDYTHHQTLIHAIRTAVFVHEQRIPAALEIDDDDRVSQHVLALYAGEAIGTGRLTPAGRIGRVAVSRRWRRQGVGCRIMAELMNLAKLSRHQEVILSAQCHAVRFYEKLGFQRVGDEFLEVGIPHVEMRQQLLTQKGL